MPRKLGEGVINKAKISDPRCDETIVLFYREPTTKEKLQYTKELSPVVRKGKQVKVQDNIYPTRVKFSKEILTGFEPSKFDPKTEEFTGGYADTEGVPFCTSKKDSAEICASVIELTENSKCPEWAKGLELDEDIFFSPDWKDRIERHAPEHLEFLSRKVFEGVTDAVDISFGDEEKTKEDDEEDV